MDKLYKYTNNQYRNRTVTSMVLCTEKEITEIDGQEIYISDFFGKHSHAEFTIKKEDFELITDDQDFISQLKDYQIMSFVGFNPFDHFYPDDLNDDVEVHISTVNPEINEYSLIEEYHTSLLYMYTLNDKIKADLKSGIENISDMDKLRKLAKVYKIPISKNGTLCRHAKSTEFLLQLEEDKVKYLSCIEENQP